MSGKRKKYLLFFIGLIGAFKFRFIGTFYGVEIIALLSYFFIPWKDYKQNPQLRRFVKLAFLWLLGSIISNIWNQNDLEESIKGIFNIVFFIAQIPFVYWCLKDNVSRWIYFYNGYAISTLLCFYMYGIDDIPDGDVDIWMFYAWTQFVVAIAAILYYNNKHKLSYIIAIGLGVIGLFNGSRNMFLSLTLASIILLFMDMVRGKNLTTNIISYRRKFTRMIITLVVGAYGICAVYEYGASTGLFGEHAYVKYEMQKNTQLGLVSGRGDFILGVEFLVRNPIIGYGSFAKDKEELRPQLCMKYGIDYSTRLAEEEGFVVPSHSIIIGQWNWHGILAGYFWLAYLLLILRALKKGTVMMEPQTAGLGIFVSIMVLWDIFFSPMGARYPYVFLMIYFILLNTEYDKRMYKYDSICHQYR